MDVIQTELVQKRKRLFVWPARFAVALSTLLCAAITIVYASRPDACAAATVFPVWVWTLAGLMLVAVARRQVRRRWQ